MSCEHETFTAQVDVTRIVGDGTPRRYSCDVRVQCADCGRKMLWPSELPIGLDLIEHLTRSVDGAELRGPLHPEGEAVVLPGPGSNELRGATPRAHPRRRPRQPGQRGEVSVRCVDLFAGAGLAAHGLGPEFGHVAFAEVDRHASAVLALRWPDVPNLGDVTKLTDLPPCDVLWASPPCTPFSTAGRRKSTADARDLWPSVAWLLGAMVADWPAVVIVENVPALLTAADDPFGRMLADFRALNYVAEWDHVPACALGQMHRRDRVFVVARRDGVLTWPRDGEQTALLAGVGGKWPRAGRWDGSLHVRQARWPCVDGPLWPTPQSSDAFGANTPEHVAAQRDRGFGTRNLREDVHAHAWPTPRTGDAKSDAGQLNPSWAEALMGAPVGWTDLDCAEPRELPGVVAPRLVGPHGEPLPSPQFEWEPPRVTTRREQRRARLRCVGNGVDAMSARTVGAAVLASVGVTCETGG